MRSAGRFYIRFGKFFWSEFYYGLHLILFQKKMNIDKKVNLFLSDQINSPITFGHFKPIVLFPTSMLTGLTPDQIEMLL